MQTLNVVLSHPYDDKCMQVLKRMINGIVIIFVCAINFIVLPRLFCLIVNI